MALQSRVTLGWFRFATQVVRALECSVFDRRADLSESPLVLCFLHRTAVACNGISCFKVDAPGTPGGVFRATVAVSDALIAITASAICHLRGPSKVADKIR